MPRRILAAIAFTCCSIIWGSTFAVCKLALQEFRPLQLVVARFALGALALSPVAFRQIGTLIAHWKTLTLLGLVGIAVPYAAQNWALELTTATAAGLIMASIPAMTSVFSVVILKESVDLRRWAGILTSIAGVLLLVLAGAAASGGAGTLAGNALQMGCAASWGLYTVLSKRAISAGIPDSAVSAGSVIAGLILCIPFALVEMAREGWASPSTAGVLQVLYLGVFASAGTFFLWNYGLRSFDASEAGVFDSTVPVWSVLTAMALLGERLASYQYAGGALAIGGVLLALSRPRRQEVSPPL
ncbi:MAG: DMT family transporter [Ignavibacteriales bacterium]